MEEEEDKIISFDDAFADLKAHYPSKTPDGRRLHSDPERCKKLYREIILVLGVVNEDKHSLILQCIDYQVKEAKKFGKLNFIQMLPTWLFQKTWMLYEEEVKKIISSKGFVDKENNSTFVNDI